MKALLVICAVLVALPALVVVGMALGPVLLVLLLVLACAAPVLLIEGRVWGRRR